MSIPTETGAFEVAKFRTALEELASRDGRSRDRPRAPHDALAAAAGAYPLDPLGGEVDRAADRIRHQSVIDVRLNTGEGCFAGRVVPVVIEKGAGATAGGSTHSPTTTDDIRR